MAKAKSTSWRPDLSCPYEERAEFIGTDNVQSHFERAPGPDGLDRWAAERDLKEDNSVSGKYVSRDTPGYGDLTITVIGAMNPNTVTCGIRAKSNPTGLLTATAIGTGSAPGAGPGLTIRLGVSRLTTTAVGTISAGGWGWCPGPVFGPPIYGPAFVGFLGGGFGLGVGWFLLGYGEPFYPWFHCRHEFVERINVRNTYIRNTNVFNNTNIHNVNYVNARNIHAVTVPLTARFSSTARR